MDPAQAEAPATTKKRDLVQLVLKGRKTLRKSLKSSDDLPATITAFQKSHGLGHEKAESMVKLLDLCGMSRAEIHQKLLATLTNKMINEVIPALDKEKQDWLLRQSFPFLERDVKELKVVPLALLKQRSDIPTEYLEKFAAQEKLWDTVSKLPNLVQQQVWEIESGGRNFEARVAPHLDAYRTTTGQRHLNYAAKASFTVASKVPSERWRGQSKELEALVNIVGARRGLLDTTCRMLMRRFCDAAGGHQTVWASLLGDFLLTYEIQTSVSKPPNMK